MLNSRKGALAVRTTRSLGLLGENLGDKLSTGGLDGYRSVASGGVMSSNECDTGVLHDYYYLGCMSAGGDRDEMVKKSERISIIVLLLFKF